MSFQTIGWAVERRYGNPLVRLVILQLAMDSGGENEWSVDLQTLATDTEIGVEFIPDILRRLVADGHLIAAAEDRASGRWMVTFPLESFPEHIPSKPKGPTCPALLRRRVIGAFAQCCNYCRRPGDDAFGPDGSPWQIDRIIAGGLYCPENVALACRPCNAGKNNRPAPPGTMSLADVEAVTA